MMMMMMMMMICTLLWCRCTQDEALGVDCLRLLLTISAWLGSLWALRSLVSLLPLAGSSGFIWSHPIRRVSCATPKTPNQISNSCQQQQQQHLVGCSPRKTRALPPPSVNQLPLVKKNLKQQQQQQSSIIIGLLDSIQANLLCLPVNRSRRNSSTSVWRKPNRLRYRLDE